MRNVNSVNKIESLIKVEAENNFLSHFRTILRVVIFWDFDVVYGNIEGLNYTIWTTNFFTSVFYPIISGEIDNDGRINISLKINLIGKIIYFLFSIFVISVFSLIMLKEASKFDHYLLACVIIIIISSVTFFLGYLGNKVFKSIALRRFKDYLNDK